MPPRWEAGFQVAFTRLPRWYSGRLVQNGCVGGCRQFFFLGLLAVALLLGSIQSVFALKFSVLASLDFFGIVHFVGLVYAVGVTMLLIVMMNQRREEKYKADASTDPLTGLFNRRGFLNNAQRVLDRAMRDGMPVAVLTFDLDRFKAVNDTFGHAVGDTVRMLFADVLSGTLRAVDVAGRLGGEEFVEVVPRVEGEAAVAMANRIRDAFQRVAQFVDGQRVGGTVSAGVAVGDDAQRRGFAEILANADVALYRAKAAGRNRVCLAGDEAAAASETNVVRIA